MDVRGTLRSFLPSLIVAGDYALRIQKRVGGLVSKVEAASIFSEALTDADIAVQTFFEVILIGRHPDLGFEPEETSRNLRYFPVNAEYIVTLDPINGTLFYKDGLPLFDIVMTILREGRVVGAVTYVPVRGEFFIGVAGEGAFTTTREEVAQDRPWAEFRLPTAPAQLALTYRCLDDVEARLKRIVPSVDLARDYDPATAWVTIFSILRGDICAFLKGDAQVIDWGAIGFIVEQAGGVVTDFAGQPIPPYDPPRRRIPNLLCCVDRDLHSRIVSELAHS